jgi:putative ABC transport system permease protein
MTAPEVTSARTGERLKPSRFSLKDLLGEATAGVLARPARAILTALGTVLGVAALVSTMGLAKTAGNQIVTRFDELSATDVKVTPNRGTLPFDSENRLTRLNGVRAAGTVTEVDVKGALTSSVPLNDPLGINELPITVQALSPGAFGAVRASLRTGRFFDASQDDLQVAVLGPGAATDLRVNRVDQQPAIFIGDQTFVVIGILKDVERRSELLDAILIPNGVAKALYGTAGASSVQIDTDVGAARLIGRQAPIALAPNNPKRLAVEVPPQNEVVKTQVEGDVNALFLLLGGVSLLIGALGIANVTLVSVLERVGEIGLRRAVGAARRHIAAQFLLESTMLGFFGGLIGTTLAVITIVAVAKAKSWVPVLDPWLPLAAPFAGALIGLVSGVYPSWRAASVEPIAALRSGL